MIMDDINLLYGVARKTRDHMRLAGLVTLAHVAAATPEELQRVKGIGPVTAPAIRANAQAWLENRPIWYNPLPDACHRDGWMFDLETYERAGRVIPWCMGWCDVHGTTGIALVAPVQEPEPLILPGGQVITLVPDSDAAWETFAAAVPGDQPVYHWTGYDMGILRATAPLDVRAQLGPCFTDLHAVFKRAVSLPLGSTSIKAISVYLGFPWMGYTDWFAAYLDYCYWLDEGNLSALARACAYQRADVQSMAWVWRWLVANRPDSLPHPPAPSPCDGEGI
jgi:predicted RecB family nuclease